MGLAAALRPLGPPPPVTALACSDVGVVAELMRSVSCDIGWYLCWSNCVGFLSLGVPLMGRTFVPSVSRSPGVTPQKKAGGPMSLSTQWCSSSMLVGFCFVFVAAVKVLFWVCCMVCSLGIHWYGYSSPSRLGPCLF